MRAASKSPVSTASITPAGELRVSISKPSALSRRRSASNTSGWSSATRMRGVSDVIVPGVLGIGSTHRQAGGHVDTRVRPRRPRATVAPGETGRWQPSMYVNRTDPPAPGTGPPSDGDAGAQAVLDDPLDLLQLRPRQIQTRRTHDRVPHPDRRLHVLDLLHEPGTEIEPKERKEPFVQLTRRLPLARRSQVEETDRLGRERVDQTRDPAVRADRDALQNHIVDPHEEGEPVSE